VVTLNMTCRSRSWVEEEGEIFRKGAVLLSREQMEGDFAGEELRREVRPPLAIIITK
jgi:protein phosphatase 1 regulatory subunit 37